MNSIDLSLADVETEYILNTMAGNIKPQKAIDGHNGEK